MSAKPLTCGICHQDHGEYISAYNFGKTTPPTSGPFHDADILARHKRLVHYEEYKAAKAQARITRAANLRAEADLKAQAEQRMEAASEKLILHWTHHGDRYGVLASCYAEMYGLDRIRRPSPEDLAEIERRELVLAEAQRSVELAKQYAWESGAPVTEAEIQAARAAGEV